MFMKRRGYSAARSSGRSCRLEKRRRKERRGEERKLDKRGVNKKDIVGVGSHLSPGKDDEHAH